MATDGKNWHFPVHMKHCFRISMQTFIVYNPTEAALEELQFSPSKKRVRQIQKGKRAH
jgi:hypothetical protein